MNSDPPAIGIGGLRRMYGTVRAVDGVDLVVRRGEVAAQLGPNGAGKSTTLNCLLGLNNPDDGRIAVFGSPPVGS